MPSFLSSGIAGAITLAGLGGCAGQPDNSALAPWTQALAATQRDGPEITVYKRGSKLVVFIGVEHDADPAGPTHRLISSAFDMASPKIVIVEGIPTAQGLDPPKLMALAQEPLDSQGLQPNGETVPTVRSALKNRSRLIGGEPSDREVREITSRFGVSERNLLGFYVLRVVPQWISQGQITDLADPRATNLINQQLIRSRAELGVEESALPNAGSWLAWRKQLNPGADPARFETKEAGPLVDGPWRTSRIGAAVSRARDTHLFDLTAKQLNEHQSVVVVFGGSHALIQRPALVKLLGQPCYVGEDIPRARLVCDLP